MSRKEIFIGGVAAVATVLFFNYVVPVVTTSYTGWMNEIIIGIVFTIVGAPIVIYMQRRADRKHYHLCNGNDGCTEMLPPGVIYCNSCRRVSAYEEIHYTPIC